MDDHDRVFERVRQMLEPVEPHPGRASHLPEGRSTVHSQMRDTVACVNLRHVPACAARVVRLLGRLMLAGRDPATVGWAVRRTWPDGGHEFVGWRTSREDAEAFRVNDTRYWRPGPIRPFHLLVQMSWADFDHHRRLRFCTAKDCTMTQLLATGGPR